MTGRILSERRRIEAEQYIALGLPLGVIAERLGCTVGDVLKVWERHRAAAGDGMTPGQEALVEAMRLEQARIYGQLQHEHHATDPDVCISEPAGVADAGSNDVIYLAPPRDRGVA